MEGVLGFILVIGIFFGIGYLRYKASNPSTPPLTIFEIKVNKVTEKYQNREFPVLKIEMKGGIKCFETGMHQLMIFAEDITEGASSSKPIFCSLEGFHAPDSPVFLYKNKIEVPYLSSELKDWINVIKIPVETLSFPFKGNRNIKLSVIIKDTLATATTRTSYFNSDWGYEDTYINHMETEELTLKLAFAIAACDNEIHKKEASIIKKWVTSRINLISDEHTEERKHKFNNIIKTEFENFNKGILLNVDEICGKMIEVSTLAQRFSAIDLCFKIIQSDDRVDHEEIKLIDQLSVKLKIDSDRFLSLKEKNLKIEMMENAGDFEINNILGIKDGMDIDKIKEILRRVHKKWNPLTSHSDPKIRKQAEDMLKLITKKHSELKK